VDKSEEKYLFELGQKIENLYTNKFSSQNEFSKTVGCDPRTTRRIIRGEQNISILLMRSIAEALEIDVKDLI